MPVPPGILYLTTFIPNALLTGLTTYLLIRLISLETSLYLPLSLTLLACLLSRPLTWLLWRSILKPKWVDARAAAKQGARLAPTVKGTTGEVIQRLGKMARDGYPGEAFHEFAQEGGNTVGASLVTQDLLFTLEPEHVKTILATQFENFEKGPIFFDQMKSLLGVGIFNADGDMWKFHRAMTRPFFTKERISDFDTYDRTCTKALELAKERLDQGHSIDFQDLVGRFTLDSATEFLAGQNVQSLNAGLPYPSRSSEKNPPSFYTHPANRFLEAFGEAQAQSAIRSSLGQDWPLLEFWEDKVAPLREVVDGFTEPLLKQALAKKVASEKGRKGEKGEAGEAEETNTCLLDHLVEHTQDQTILKDEVMNLLVAGRDTTASLLSFGLYILTQHPEIEAKLREEIFDKVGPKDRPTYGQMRDMRYTRAFLNEVLRLYPPVPVDNRSTNKNVILPSKTGLPIYVPAGTNCIYSVMYMHRRTDLWGPDALKFDPMRFIDERVNQYLTPNPFIFTPFNAGPRICLGQQFAYHESTFFLVRLLQNFTAFELDSTENLPPNPEWKDFPDDRRSSDKIKPKSHLTMYIKGGLWIKMKPFEENIGEGPRG